MYSLDGRPRASVGASGGRLRARSGNAGGGSDERRSRRIDDRRRRVLRVGGAALAVTSAGCLGFGTDDPEGNESAPEPRIRVVDASVSETEITVEDELEVTGTLENEGDRAGTFHAELRIDGSIIDTKEVTVEAGETATVTFAGSFAEPGEYVVSVNDVTAGTVLVELPPAEFELVDASVSATTVAPGEAVEVTATVENVGGQEGTFTVRLRIDGEVVETQDVTVDADETASVRFVRRFDEPDTYEVAVNDLAVDTIVVAPPAEFEVTATSIDRTFIRVGDEVEIAARVANVGGQSGTFDLEVQRDGEVVASRELTIAAGEETTERFSIGFEERGAYAMSIGGTDVDTVYVTECSTRVEETITVEERSSHTYAFDLKENVEVRIATETRDGVDPIVSVDAPSGEPPVDGTSDGSVRESFITDEAGQYRLRLENGATLPWRDGTWDVRVDVCTW